MKPRAIGSVCDATTACVTGAECVFSDKKAPSAGECKPVVRHDLNQMCARDSDCATGYCQKPCAIATRVLSGNFELGADCEHIKGTCKLPVHHQNVPDF
jgi:hypothetical protein